MVEHEMLVTTSNGTVPESMLKSHNEQMKRDQERRLQAMREKEQALRTDKNCFLKLRRNLAHTACRKNCLFYSTDDDRCTFAGGAVKRDPIGADCPVIGQKCIKDCAMYGNGICALMNR